MHESAITLRSAEIHRTPPAVWCVCALLLVAGGFALWGTMAQLSGAVIASGTLVVDSNVKKVQHPTGGVIGELRVKEGDHVEAGEIVVRLDETQTRANLAVLVNAINELLAREARLDAERTGANEIRFPDQLLAQRSDAVVEKVLAGEQKHFELASRRSKWTEAAASRTRCATA